MANSPYHKRAFYIERQEMDWRKDGLCAQVDPAVMFPAPGESARPGLDLCSKCPVIAECLEFALTSGERHGIWGGKTERERHTLEKARGLTRTTRITECGTPAGAKRHYRDGEKPCEPCREASVVARRERRWKGRAA